MLTLSSDVQTNFLKGQVREYPKTRPQGANVTAHIVYTIIPLDGAELEDAGLVTTNVLGLCVIPKGARVIPSLCHIAGGAIGFTANIGIAGAAAMFATAAAVGSAFASGTDLAAATYPTEMSEQVEVIATITGAPDPDEKATVMLAWLMP